MESEDDDLDIIGTPLEPLEEDEIPSKKPYKDDTVRDEKGCQRFHGAFTGGFSAGYFNTVGSKEGWAPATFTSSRSKKAESKAQQAEDFMDDEDFGAFGIAPRRIQATAQFHDSSHDHQRKRNFPLPSEGPIPGEPPLKDIVKPSSESIGVYLLKKMGWRPGWGVGQRIKKKTKKKPEEGVYGCSPPPGGSDSEEEDPFAASFTFAPDDVDVLFATPKDNLHGIGYSGLDRSSVLSAPINLFEPTVTKARVEKGRKKLAITGQAFGIGAFEDEDEDIYSKEDMSQYNFSLDGNISQENQTSQPNPSKLSVSRVCKVLDGFHLSTKPQPEKKVFLPPLVTSKYVPIHKSSKNEEGKKNQLPHNKFLGRHILTTEERGTLLGERKIITPPEKNKASLDTTKLEMDKKAVEVASTSLEPLPSSCPLSFKPFANDEAKQQRYEKYLKLVQAGKKDCLSSLQSSSLTEWEKLREQEEFQRASSLYLPLSSTLGSRFVGGKQLENDREIPAVIIKEEEKSDQEKAAEMKMFGHLTREKFEWRPAALLCRRFNVPNPYPHSSFVGLTKVKQEKSLFFNFLNIQPEAASQSNHPLAVCSNSKSKVKTEHSPSLPEKSHSGNKEVAVSNSREVPKEAEMDQDGKKLAGEATEEKPSMDLFKMIFQDSSDESSDLEKEEKAEEAEKPKDETDPSLKEVSGTEHNGQSENNEPINHDEPSELVVNSFSVMKPKKQAFGLFANLDLDALSKRRTPSLPANIIKDEDNASSNQGIQELNETVNRVGEKNSEEANLSGNGSREILSSELYGPRLPPGLLSASEAPSRKNHKKSKHRKEKHRHKHKKYKSKKSRHKSKHSHKHSKKRHTSNHNTSRTKDSSNDSSSLDSGEPSNVDILQKVRQLQKNGRFSKS